MTTTTIQTIAALQDSYNKGFLTQKQFTDAVQMLIAKNQ
jgi:hypothetical protein